jgi:CelD/BcsL family acetyltransferase involved in cellulose biosynthesis
MTKPMLLADFARLPPAYRVGVGEGLPAAIDAAAARAPESHRFLRHGWFAAALAAYGGQARTWLVEDDVGPAIALPLVTAGPRWAGLAQLPGCYWPFRSFPAGDVAAAGWDVLLLALAREWRAVRLGPVQDDDAAVGALIAAARARGWRVLSRDLGRTWRLDMAGLRAEGDWPRASTLKKNRFHEKHLAARGPLDWRFLGARDWPAGFDALAGIEETSWIASRTDGRDAKFTRGGHGAFWRAAARDPVLAGMMSAALLTVDGRPAAFSFDLDTGATRYAIANSYDPVLGKHSPGKLLHYRNCTAAIECGVRTIDWGSGDSGYKQVLGATEGPTIRDWLLMAPGVWAWVARLMRQWKRA